MQTNLRILPVVFHEGEGHEEIEVSRGDLGARPDGLPDEVDLVVGELALKVQQEPPEIEAGK